MNTKFSYEQFQRQLILKKFGETAQLKLCQSNVLVIGAGGLGCPAMQYLAAIGIGHIGIVDYDVVSMSNLPRQILFNSNDIGKLKTEVAKQKLLHINEATTITIYSTEISQLNALEIIQPYEVIIDCTDNFITRYIINDACVLLDKPLVFGAVFQYEGQVSVFNFNKNNSVNYRDLFPVSPSNAEAPNCAEAGVFNIATGIIGMLQAAEAIKIITGIGEILSNKLMTYNSFNASFYTVDILKNKLSAMNMPHSKDEFKRFNYNLFCGLNQHDQNELSVDEFELYIQKEDVQLIDIRNENEQPRVDELKAINIPLSLLKKNIHLLDKEKKVILFCHAGIRTQEALEILKEDFHFTNVAHLKGGLVKWLAYKTQ